MAGWELFDEREKRSVDEVMSTGVLMRYGFGAKRGNICKSREMENAIKEKTGAKFALLVSNGTGALTTALAAMGVGAGDEVIMPPFTFVATFESVLAAGATPVIAEVDDTLCLDPKSVEANIGPRTKVVMPVHMCGAAAEMDELKKICDDHRLTLFEDACQAFGASYKGRAVGTIGEAGCYSFDFNKIVTCGEGGAIVTDSKTLYERADMYHDHGHDHSDPDRGREGHPFFGYNYRISELNAAIGAAQIAKTEMFVRRQRANKRPFVEELGSISGVTMRRLPDPSGDSATFVTFFAPDESSAARATESLKAAGVEGVFHWYENNWHYIRNWRHFKERKSANKMSSDIFNGMKDYSQHSFASDAIMSRCVSITIKLGWEEAEAAAVAKKAAEAVRSAL